MYSCYSVGPKKAINLAPLFEDIWTTFFSAQCVGSLLPTKQLHTKQLHTSQLHTKQKKLHTTLAYPGFYIGGMLDSMHAKRTYYQATPIFIDHTHQFKADTPIRGVHYQESNLLSLAFQVQEAPRRAGKWLLMNQLAITKLDLAVLSPNNSLSQYLQIYEQLLNVSMNLRIHHCTKQKTQRNN